MKNNLKFFTCFLLLVCVFVTAFSIVNVNNGEFSSAENVSIDHIAKDPYAEYSLMNRPGVHYYMASSIGDARIYLNEVIKESRSSATSFSYEPEESAYWIPNNISQNSFNDYVNATTHPDVTGTCSLVAMLIIKNFICRFTSIDIGLTDEEVALELVQIAEEKGNQYRPDVNGRPSTGAGTSSDTIRDIFQTFFTRHGYSDVVVTEKISELIKEVNTYMAPCIYNITSYKVDTHDNLVGAHSIVICGSITFKVTYTYRPWYWLLGLTTTESYQVPVILNGWYNGNNGNFGEHLQILIPSKKAAASHEYEVHNWDDFL